MVAAKLNELAHERQQFQVRLGQRPIDPTNLVILAIGIVVAVLGVAHLIARNEHRHSLRQQQRGEQIALLTCSQYQDLGVFGRAFHAAIPALVVVSAVPVFLAICLVVLALVAHQVVQDEAIVGGDEIQAGARAPSIVRVQVARTS